MAPTRKLRCSFLALCTDRQRTLFQVQRPPPQSTSFPPSLFSSKLTTQRALPLGPLHTSTLYRENRKYGAIVKRGDQGRSRADQARKYDAIVKPRRSRADQGAFRGRRSDVTPPYLSWRPVKRIVDPFYWPPQGGIGPGIRVGIGPPTSGSEGSPLPPRLRPIEQQFIIPVSGRTLVAHLHVTYDRH